MDGAGSGLREQVRARYAAAAAAVSAGSAGGPAESGCCGPAESAGCGPAESAESAGCGAAAPAGAAPAACCSAGAGAPESVQVEEGFGAGMYSADERAELPAPALAASLGCGNPLAVAELRPGERVLDLGSGGGIDVLLSARRVGPGGFAYGVDMTPQMLALARANAVRAGVSNVAFVPGTIEDVPLPDAAVDVVISNCVINLSVDKPAVLAEMFRLLRPGGRIGISDIVAEDHLSPAERAERGSYVGCIAGALTRSEYLAGLAAAGFADVSVTFTHQAADGMHAAIVRATKPVGTAAQDAGPQHAGPRDAGPRDTAR
jgi:arsenite methyltransferase